MELWNYLQILGQRNQGWLFKKDNVEERLSALVKILEFGYPSSIQHLVPFLKDGNNEIRHTTCNVIVLLFDKIQTKNGFYDMLKHSDISRSDIDFYANTFSAQQCVTLFAIATLNGNGYVREKAIKKLIETNHGKAIPFLIYRLADWVPAVRQIALKGIEQFKAIAYINALVDNLTIFEWLQKVERTDLSYIHADILNYVVVENKRFVFDNFSTFSDRTRVVIAKQVSNAAGIDLEDLKILLNDKHFLVRSFALSHFEKLTQNEINNLLIDKSARVRLQALYKLKNKEGFIKLVLSFLSDNSASIREFARFSLKNDSSKFTTIYIENLKNKVNVTGSLNGLAEINGKQFSESVVPFLNDKNLKIRRTAFLALQKLDSSEAYKFAYDNLDSEFLCIRNSIIDFFSITTTEEALTKAREIYANGDFELKKSMLKLFSRIGKWSTIGDIMLGTINENENIRELSVEYLQLWRNRAIRYFTQPKQGDLDRAIKILRFAYEHHEEKKYFDKNPLTEIDFYLR